MKLKTWTMTLSFALLLGGCVKPEYCDIAEAIPFKGQNVIQYLAENDRRLLEGVVGNNQKYERFCM